MHVFHTFKELFHLFACRTSPAAIFYEPYCTILQVMCFQIMKKVFFELYHEPLKCLVGHGGNECGVFKKMFPEMDIVTSGAIYGNIHGPQEFLDLASFDRAWILLTRLIAAL